MKKLLLFLVFLSASAIAQKNELLNVKLIPLEVNPEGKTIKEKYSTSFGTECNCNASALYIDAKSKKLYVFNYCEEVNLKDETESEFVYDLASISQKGTQTIFKFHYAKEEYVLTFTKRDGFIYELQVTGDSAGSFNKDVMNSEHTFTTAAHKKEITTFDCGDYGG